MDFESLRLKIRSCLGDEDGITTTQAHLEELMDSMRCYKSVDGEWERFALGDPSRAYTRNLVDDCNSQANLLVLVWNPKKSSPVHCHSAAHCIMKVLSGTLEEELYHWPADGRPMTPRPATLKDLAPARDPCQDQPMKVKRHSVLNRDDVAYISDALGLHRIGNPSETEVAVSLHLYTPPWAAKYGCQIFSEKTGQGHRTTQCGFFSIDGQRCS